MARRYRYENKHRSKSKPDPAKGPPIRSSIKGKVNAWALLTIPNANGRAASASSATAAPGIGQVGFVRDSNSAANSATDQGSVAKSPRPRDAKSRRQTSNASTSARSPGGNDVAA